MNVYSGEIVAGLPWKTDPALARMQPYIYAVSLSPQTVTQLGKVFIQVFVNDTLMPYYPMAHLGGIFSGED